jgi:hypothetical protein
MHEILTILGHFKLDYSICISLKKLYRLSFSLTDIITEYRCLLGSKKLVDDVKDCFCFNNFIEPLSTFF